jgi:hypothetical protein
MDRFGTSSAGASRFRLEDGDGDQRTVEHVEN